MASSKDIKAGGAYLSLGLRPAMERGLNQARSQLRKFSRGSAVIGGALLGGASVVLGPLLAASLKFAAAGDRMHKMSIRTGVSVEALSQLEHAANASGTTMEDVASGMFRANRRIGNAASTGAGPAAKALDRLKLSAAELSKETPDQQMLQLAGALQGVENAAERDQLAFEVFGGSFQKIKPLLADGEKGIVSLMEEADRLGITMSTKSANSAAAYTDAMGALTGQLNAAQLQIGGALAPMLTDLLKVTQPLLTVGINWIKNNKQLLATIAKVAAIVGVAGGALLLLSGAASVLGMVLGGAATVVSVLGAVLGFVLSPAGLVIAAVAAATYALLKFTEAGRTTSSVVARGFSSLLGIVGPAARGITSALSVGDLSTAGAIAMETLKIIFAKGLRWISSQFEGAFGDTVSTIANQVLAGDLAGAWNTVIDLMYGTWGVFAQGLFNTFEQWVDRIVKKWETATGYIASKITDLNLFGEAGIGNRGIEADAKRAASLRKSIETAKQEAQAASAQGDTKGAASQLKVAADFARSLEKLEGSLGRGALDEIKQISREILGGQGDNFRDAAKDSLASLRSTAAEAIKKTGGNRGGGNQLDASIAASELRLQELIAGAKAAADAAYADLAKKESGGGPQGLRSQVLSSGFAAAVAQSGSGPQERLLKASEETARNTRELAGRKGRPAVT